MDENELSCETISPSLIDSQNLSRFRHASCLAPNTSKLFVYGGKFYDEASSTSSILNDAFLIDQETGKTISITVILEELFLKIN